MSGEAERGTRFARDLRRIRRDRGVSLTDIHDATKMAYDLIKRFEHNALIGHPQFNRVYLRLFVRGYAEHLNMDVEMALEAFELAMKGRYTGSLAKAYLGESGEERQEESPKQEKKTGREEPAPPESDQVTEATPSAQAERESAKIPSEESAEPTPQSDSEVTDPEVADSGATVSAALSTEQPTAREASLAKTSAARKISSSKAPFPRRTSAGTSSRTSSRTSPKATPSTDAGAQAPAKSGSGSGPDPRWIFLGVLVVVVGLGVWGLTRVAPPNDMADDAVPASGMTDVTAPANDVTNAAIPANGVTDATVPANDIPIQSLPDTLNIVIVADKGSVAPIRVTVDNDLRRPYWIDRGNSMTFRMADRIILEQQLDSVTVQVEGMTYPVSRPTGEDTVTLTRDALRSWFSSIQR